MLQNQQQHLVSVFKSEQDQHLHNVQLRNQQTRNKFRRSRLHQDQCFSFLLGTLPNCEVLPCLLNVGQTIYFHFWCMPNCMASCVIKLSCLFSDVCQIVWMLVSCMSNCGYCCCACQNVWLFVSCMPNCDGLCPMQNAKLYGLEYYVCLLAFIPQAQRITAVALHLEVFQGIVFFLREALG